MSTTGVTFEEMSQTLTGFDEISVQKFMGMDVYADGESRPVWLMRSLVFVHLRRPLDQGGKALADPDAKARVMEMPLAEINNYFETDAEAMPEDPDTTAGKDSSLSAAPPTS